ncbi:MAG: HEAT repeat domain-containing protein [Candidatus Methylomirabilales bacterium]
MKTNTRFSDHRRFRRFAIGAMLVTAWLSTATAAALGADRQAPTKPPGSHGIETLAAESPTLRLRFDDGLLSLHASHRSLAEVVGAIQKATGIRLHYPLPLPGSITESFTALPITPALQRLFGPEAGLMFRYAAGDEAPGPLAVPEEVWVIGTIRARGAGGPVAAADENEMHAPAPVAAAEAPPDPAAAPAVTAEDPGLSPGLGDEEAIDGLLGMARDEDPEMRLQALATLSQGAEGTEADKAIVKLAIDAALTDRDARVRGQAIQVLASRGGAEAMWHLRQALRDPDPGVRILAIEKAGSGEQGKALLEEALSDQDESVRAVARARLESDGIEGRPL